LVSEAEHKLHLALERNKSLEMWVDVLESKVAQLQGHAGLQSLQSENDSLKAQLHRLKETAAPSNLYATQFAGGGGGGGQTASGSGLADGLRVAELERKLVALENACAKASDFHDQVCE
jgi:hypothetical protein